MGRDLSRYLRVLRNERRGLQKALRGNASAYSILVSRKAIEVMEHTLRHRPGSVLVFELDPKDRPMADVLWQREMYRQAVALVDPQQGQAQRYRRLEDSYKRYAKQMSRNVDRSVTYVSKRRMTRVRHNVQTRTVVKLVADLLVFYPFRHRFDPDLFRTPPAAGLHRFLTEERIDLMVALRATLRLGPDVSTWVVPPPQRPAYVDAVEFAVGLIPIVGNAVAAYEAYTGKDLFGYQLSDVERGILGASVLLPVAGRMVKGGRALYTAGRMRRLYGEDAAKWSYTLAMGERLSKSGAGLGKLRNAEKLVALKGRLKSKQAGEVAQLLMSLKLKNKKLRLKPPEAARQKAFNRLAQRHKFLSNLDVPALERVAGKGTNVNHIKGQMLEELLEDRVVRMLRDPAGKAALGLEKVKGRVHFIPGHLVRDLGGRQITDGMIVTQVGEKLQIVAVFEAKAGKYAARELSRKSMSRKKLSKADAAELDAYARDILRDLVERARTGGPPVTKTLDQIKKEIKLTELGGQIRRDVERLDGADLYIGSQKVSVHATPKSTRYFGVLPSDVSAKSIKRQLAEAGLTNFDVLGVGVRSRDLTAASKSLRKELKALAP